MFNFGLSMLLESQGREGKICDGTDHLNATLNIGMTSLQLMVGSARSVGWGSNEAVILLYLVPYLGAHMYSMQTQGSETLVINTTDQNLH